MSKLRTKNALFEYFRIGVLKNCCHISNQHPRICLNGNIREKFKMPKFEHKNA